MLANRMISLKTLTLPVINWLFGLTRHQKLGLQIAFDVVVAPLSILLAFFLRFETMAFLESDNTYISMLVVLIMSIGVHAKRGLYNGFTRHISLDAAQHIAIGSAMSAAALILGNFIFELQMPLSVPVIFMVLFCFFSLGMRLFIRALGRSIYKKNIKNVAIYGAGTAGIQLMAALRHNPSYRVQMFVDDELELSGKNIGGIPIYNLSLAKKKFTDLSVNTLLLAVPSNVEATREKVFDLLLDHPLKVKTVPSISALISGGSTISDLTDIKVEDLLGREPVTCNDGLMAKNITGKRVFVTGAGGSIGSELCRQIIEWNPSQLIMLDVSEFGSYAIFEELKGKVSNDSIEIIPLIDRFKTDNLLKEFSTSLKSTQHITRQHINTFPLWNKM